MQLMEFTYILKMLSECITCVKCQIDNPGDSGLLFIHRSYTEQAMSEIFPRVEVLPLISVGTGKGPKKGI